MITSQSNERVKSIRKLQDRKARQERGVFYLEGLRIVAEAVEQGAEFESLIYAPELLSSEFGQKLVAGQQLRGVPVIEVSKEVFQHLSQKEGPQGLAATVRQHWLRLDDVQHQTGRTWVALDSVADPGNLGTILRTHDATGGQGVILLDHTTDPYDPAAVRASMGALFTQSLVKATYTEFETWKRRQNVPVIGTSDSAAQDYHAFRYPDMLVLLMGSERQGLQERYLALCDAVVSIPMLGASDSLNLAVATGVVLYEILNQRRDTT
jgi:RNA methyltransferase, TrmH family